jgi:RNA polymerase sigma-70 factor (ECF subfamily)
VSSSGHGTPRPDIWANVAGRALPHRGAPSRSDPAGSLRIPFVAERAHARETTAADEAAFRAFVDLHASPVLRICYRILGRLDEAEDAAQETFVLAYRARGTYRGDGTTDAWIARIATRECWRRHAKLAQRAARVRPLEDALTAGMSDGKDPATEALTAERGAAVREAVARLPEPYREVVTLRYFGDVSPTAIAELLGRPEGTVRSQLHRGLERLRLRLQKVWP